MLRVAGCTLSCRIRGHNEIGGNVTASIVLMHFVQRPKKKKRCILCQRNLTTYISSAKIQHGQGQEQ